jgi:hypothetical protein
LTKIKVARGKHRGKETYIGHPTQTVTSVYPWLARPVPAERPAAVPRRRVAAAATRANPAGFRTMAEIRAANKAAGMHYFDPKTMKFFASKIEGGPYGGHYFVTSEKTGFDSRKRAYTVRKAEADGSIVTVGEFLGFAHKEDAVDHARALARRKNPSVSFRTKSGRAVSFKTKKR